jgi:RNA polymerase sigma factor (sigma-70 family)
LMTRTHGMDDMESFRCSLYRATVQCAMDVIRKVRRRRGEESNVDLIAVDQRETPETNEIRTLVNASVAKLEENERLPVTLCFYEGLSVVEAAQTLEVPRETVRARLARALGKLRLDLRGHGKDIGSASLVAFMWRDGGMLAPPALAARLDQTLPGKACSELPKSARLKPFDPASLQTAWPFVVKASVAALLAASIAVTLIPGRVPTASRSSETSSKPIATNVQPAYAPEKSPVMVVDSKVHSQEQDTGEETAMNLKMKAMALAGSALLATGSMAADPKPDVAAALKQIEARKAEKAAAQARQTQAWARAEAGEKSAAPGSPAPEEKTIIVAPGGGVIEIRE